MATLNLRPIPDDLHDALRIEAARRRTSVRALVVQALQEWVHREANWAEQLRARPPAVPRRKGSRNFFLADTYEALGIREEGYLIIPKKPSSNGN